MKIDRIKVKNFKSLKDVDIELSNITLLTGVNSSGKSSLIQTLLLLKQNEDKFFSLRGNKVVNINDRYVKLGNKKDILFENAFQENIEITIFSDKLEHSLIFGNEKLHIELTDLLPEELEETFNLFYDDFQYITTDRIAPNISYGVSDEEVDKNLIGHQGEFTAHYLAHNRHKKLNIKLLKHKNSITEQLLENVSYWLSEISNGIEVSAKLYSELQQVNLTYTYTYGDQTTQNYTPLNVGFGITYVLSVIVAILKSKPGDLLIIENPESHLHPAGQSKMAELCAIAASSGVQIIIETHSDHFLNGLRVATKKKMIQPEQSQIYYFRKEKNGLATIADNLRIDDSGRINQEWPKGFFDEWDNRLDELLW